MASMTNNEKILQAVLLDDKLMEFGGYTAEDIGNIYQATIVLSVQLHKLLVVQMKELQKENFGKRLTII